MTREEGVTLPSDREGYARRTSWVCFLYLGYLCQKNRNRIIALPSGHTPSFHIMSIVSTA